MTSLFAHGIFKSFLRLFHFLCNGQSLSVLPWLPCCFRATNKTTNGSLVCLIDTGKRLKVVSGMTSISCQMVSVQIWTQPALLSQWSMSSLRSVPFLPSGDLSKISWVDDLLHSWHRGVNDYHYNFVLCSAGWESKLNMQWLCHHCQWHTICPHCHIQYSSLNPAKRSHPSKYFISITIYLQKTFLRSSISFWGKLFWICKIAIFPFNTVFPFNIILYQPIN